MNRKCNPTVATVCTHSPKSEQFRLFSGVILIGQAMCNGARDVSVLNSERELTESEWQEYCDRTIARRIVKKERQA